MKAQDKNCKPTDRRKQSRWSAYSFLHATATLSDSVSIEPINQNQPERCWTGLLADISHKGAQIILPCDCEKHFRENQQIAMRIKVSFLEFIKVDVTAQVKSIVPAKHHNGVCVEVQFTGLESNAEAEDKISKICEYGKKLQAANTA